MLKPGGRDQPAKILFCTLSSPRPTRSESLTLMPNVPSPSLEGIKVIELGTLIAGPFCSRILAEFGAEVIKIESPEGGDQLRQWRKMYEGTSLWWYAQARNKKSVTVNLRAAEGQQIVRKLAASADI